MEQCSLCDRPENEVRKLVPTARKGILICDRCVAQAVEGLSLVSPSSDAPEHAALPKPKELKSRLDQYVIAQEQAKVDAAVAVYNHYKRREALRQGLQLDVEIQKSNILLMGPTGCHRKGQKVLMLDGTLKAVEDIRVGDLLMGPNSTPRKVLELVRGREAMAEIRPTKGEPWVVNQGHLLTLARICRTVGAREGRAKTYRKVHELVDVSVRDWSGWSQTQKHIHKLVRTGVDFPAQEPLPLDPYFLGVLLGDGSLNMGPPVVTTMDEVLVAAVHQQAQLHGLRVVHYAYDDAKCPRYALSGTGRGPNPITMALRGLNLEVSCESKHIPHIYKVASRSHRLAILAGLLDTDGHVHGEGYDFVNKSKALVEDITFVARSLGFAAYPQPTKKRSQKGTEGVYYRVFISGDTSEIPVRISYKRAAKRKQVKNVLHTGFTVKSLPAEDYYGFVLDRDHRYLLDDFTITHNCGKTQLARSLARMLGVPFYVGDATKLTMSGYVGDDVESLLQGLLAACGGDASQAEWGIVFLDEADKLARKSGRNASGFRDVTGEGVQQSLLKLVEGSLVQVPRGTAKLGMTNEHDLINTENILFILAGSFAGIEDIVKDRKNKKVRVGFGGDVRREIPDTEVYNSIEEADILEFGIIPELLGRIPVHTSVLPLTEEEMVRVLTEPKDALTRQFQALFKIDGIDLQFDEGALKAIGREAKSRPTGARALRSILERILKPYAFELPSDPTAKGLRITLEVVEKKAEAIITRVGAEPPPSVEDPLVARLRERAHSDGPLS